jgi:hypothetical protein
MLYVFSVPISYAVCLLRAFKVRSLSSTCLSVCCMSFPYLHDIPVMLCNFFSADLLLMYCNSKCVTAKYIVMLIFQRDPEMRLLRLLET